MKLAIAYSSKDEVENTDQTLDRLCASEFGTEFDIYWGDGSATDAGLKFFRDYRDCAFHSGRVLGGADAAIAWKLSEMLKHPYTHIGLLENDVLLDEDWFEPTMALFEKGRDDGLDVGAVSPRSYVDRVLVQRDGYAVMHNIGAGVVIFTREAAEIVLRSFRTHWWPDNVRLFAQLSGIDLRTFAAFRGQEQWVTTDWRWEAQLARHGLASLALTPAKCRMVGQKIPLEKQGLKLVDEQPDNVWRSASAFAQYRDTLARVRAGDYALDRPGPIFEPPEGGHLFFPHQLGYLAGGVQWHGASELQWSQGFGPFAYRAGPHGASLAVRISGTCGFLVGGGQSGAQIIAEDMRSGFRFAPDLPPNPDNVPASIQVPGTPVPRTVMLTMNEGAVFYGLACADRQMLNPSFRFDWTQLPAAPGEAQRSGEAK
jgi:hypothetical protein